MTKKFLSVILSILMLLSFMSVMSVSADDNETEILGPGAENNTNLPEIAEECNRYFFYMPKSWENELSQTAGIYWWEGTDAQDKFPGVEAHKADAEGLFYYDVPKDVWTVMWSNMITYDTSEEGWQDSLEYKLAKVSGSIGVEYYEAGESELYPDGLESFNNMVWVADFSDCYCMEFDVRGVCGDWYYYYGNGEYGTTEEKGEVVYTERSLNGECCRHERQDYSDTLPDLSADSNRYFFYMPDSWEFESRFDLEVIFDKTGIANIEYADAEDVFFCDLPKTAKEFYIVNKDEKICSTSPAPVVPDFNLQDCDGKILVIDPSWTVTSIIDGKNINYGFWYNYYGKGKYGELPKVAEGCNRYFFYMPDFWCNDYTDTAGIYWWEGTDAQSAYPGLKANKADAEGIYYYDVPKDVETILWNNYMDLLLEEWESFRHLDIFTANIHCSEYDSKMSETYPDGIESFDGMIFVISSLYTGSDYVPYRMLFEGEWYYYYGNGEYGTTPNRGDGEVYSDEVMVKEDSILPPILGDADENEIVNIKDATHIQKFVAGMDVAGVFELSGDVDGSGDITVKDATAIQKYLAGIDTGYKINKRIWYKN